MNNDLLLDTDIIVNVGRDRAKAVEQKLEKLGKTRGKTRDTSRFIVVFLNPSP